MQFDAIATDELAIFDGAWYISGYAELGINQAKTANTAE